MFYYESIKAQIYFILMELSGSVLRRHSCLLWREAASLVSCVFVGECSAVLLFGSAGHGLPAVQEHHAGKQPAGESGRAHPGDAQIELAC